LIRIQQEELCAPRTGTNATQQPANKTDSVGFPVSKAACPVTSQQRPNGAPQSNEESKVRSIDRSIDGSGDAPDPEEGDDGGEQEKVRTRVD